MLCIDNRITDVYFNLAAEEYLLKTSREDIFMLWQNEPSVIIGKHQNVFDEINLGFAYENRIKIARRFSGGGAVFHDGGNLNLTFIETNASVNFDIYSLRIIEMLSSLGIKASADDRRAINIGGLKISGSAQSIHKDRILYHATLLFSSNIEQLVTSLESQPGQKKATPKRKVAVKSVKSPVTNMQEHLPSPNNIEDIKNYIVNYYLTRGSENRTYAFSKEDISSIDEIRNIKYAAKSWIYDGEFLKK